MSDAVPTVELHIEELVLRGFEGVNPAWVAIVVQQELTRLLVEEGVPPSWRPEGPPARLEGSVLEVEPGVSAETLGVRVARSVYRALHGGDGRPTGSDSSGRA